MRNASPALPIVLLAVCALVAVVSVLGPTSVLQPFTLHTDDLIARSYTLDAWGRWLALALLLVGAWLFTLAWRRGGWIARSVAAVPMVALLAAGLFSGERFVEWVMFEPLETIRFVSLEEATHVADDEMVMGVVADGQARAYPVRMTAYHHLLNDRLADEPYVVTY